MQWNAEVIQSLITLWNEEQISVTQIADRLGTTRNAVMGKIHRLRQAGHPVKQREVGKSPEGSPRPPRRRSPTTHKHSSLSAGEKSVVGVVLSHLNTPSPNHYVDIEALSSHHCREVVAVGPKALYCGAQKQEKSSFCPFHHAKNWVEPQKRMR